MRLVEMSENCLTRVRRLPRHLEEWDFSLISFPSHTPVQPLIFLSSFSFFFFNQDRVYRDDVIKQPAFRMRDVLLIIFPSFLLRFLALSLSLAQAADDVVRVDEWVGILKEVEDDLCL